MTKYTPIIGMEVHVELNTQSKMFCGCSAKHFHIKPNTHTCPVCLGLPGALPVPNKKAIDWTILIAHAFNCHVNSQSKFDRKHYFYPDLSKGYQISQYDQPISQNGYLVLDKGKKIKINRIHLEEDTGKLLHKTIKNKKVSLIDFNRSGVPLVEIVTQPDISSGQEAKEYLKKLRDIIRSLKVSDCDMEKGSMRLEANISLSKNLKKLPSYKVEIKNLNSFRFVDQAINYEIDRQTRLLEKGITPDQETKGYDSKLKKTFSQRSKEEAQDYRYFPEPDIPPMIFTDKYIAQIKNQLPTLPEDKVKILIKDNQINQTDARLLVANSDYLYYFQTAIKLIKDINFSPQKLTNMIINKKVDINKISPKKLIKQLTEKSQTQIKDTSSLTKIISQVLSDNKPAVQSFKKGKTAALGFLVGQVMSQTQGKANPQLTKKLLLEKLK